MLFETVTRTIKNSNDQARKLTKTILNVQSIYLKNELIIDNKKLIDNKKKLYFVEKNGR